MKKIVFLFTIIFLAGFMSCKDNWNDHYDQGNNSGETATEALGEFLVLQDKYTRYVEFLKETQVLDTLNSNQILTVWAVTNENMPSNEELNQYSAKEKKQMALHSINYMPIYYPKFELGKKIQTMAGKNIYMGFENSQYTIDEILIDPINQICKNGVIHEIRDLMIPRKNIYEHIENLPDEYSILRDSLLSRNDTIFDISSSFPIDVDPTGNIIYDSVFVIRNNFIGAIRNEEVEYTFMLPKNEVIFAAFEEMRTYLLQDTLSYELLEEMNDWWLKALFYPEKITNYEKDISIYSVYNKHWRTDIQKVDESNVISVSNGIIYPVEEFVFPKSSLLKDVEYIIPDIWQRASQEEREQYFSFGGAGYTTTPSEIIFTDTQLNNNPWAKDISNTWWRAHSTITSGQDTVYAEFSLLERDLRNNISPIMLYPGSYDLHIWLRSYSTVPISISVISDAVEGATLDAEGKYSLILQDQVAQSEFTGTDVATGHYRNAVATLKITKPTDALRINFVIWEEKGSRNKNINIRGIRLTANREEMY